MMIQTIHQKSLYMFFTISKINFLKQQLFINFIEGLFLFLLRLSRLIKVELYRHIPNFNNQIIVNIWSMEVECHNTHKFRMQQLVHASNQTLAHTSLLLVGVGGIGCEILKVLSKSAVGSLHILDMDTIQQKHKGLSKSLTARESILKLNPKLKITAHHMNIKDLPVAFFRQFNFIILALDNIEARNYVNKIGIRLNIPIVDAGTLAYKGNATTIIAGVSRCYSCEPKSSNQKVFPVCTIRMRPQKPIHCIVWAKMLFEAIFAGDNEDNDLKDLSTLCQSRDERAILHKLFQQDIEDIKNAKSDTDNKLSQVFAKNIKVIPSEFIDQGISQRVLQKFNQFDKVQSQTRSVSLFVESFQRLIVQKQKLGAVVFEKDDDQVIHFISSAANLRMFCFGIQQQSFNQVKNMAGNIVPAIASTNSIVSGIEVIQMLKYLRGQQDRMRSYFIQNQHNKIMAVKLQKPLPDCRVCSDQAIPVTLECNFNQYTLQDLVSFIQQENRELSEFSINQNSKEIYNSDDPKQILLAKTIFQICQTYELDLVLTDEDFSKKVCVIWMIHNQNVHQPIITNKHRLRPQTKLPAADLPQQTKDDEDDDVVVFEDDSPELEIIEVRKREPINQTSQSTDVLRKRPKLQ